MIKDNEELVFESHLISKYALEPLDWSILRKQRAHFQDYFDDHWKLRNTFLMPEKFTYPRNHKRRTRAFTRAEKIFLYAFEKFLDERYLELYEADIHYGGICRTIVLVKMLATSLMKHRSKKLHQLFKEKIVLNKEMFTEAFLWTLAFLRKTWHNNMHEINYNEDFEWNNLRAFSLGLPGEEYPNKMEEKKHTANYQLPF